MKCYLNVFLTVLQVIPLHLPPGDPTPERTLQIDGTTDQIEHAKQLVNEILSGEVCFDCFCLLWTIAGFCSVYFCILCCDCIILRII